MNLVKAQELVKGMPLQELQNYANGLSPQMIPPWLAAGEIQAKMDQQQKMAAMSGAAQGPMPSVKEQIEQKANALQMQQLMQQQAMQRMAQQGAQASGPAPAGLRTPRPQPQESQGLAGADVQFGLAGGGIVAFNGEDGSEVKPKYETPYDRMNRENRERAAADAGMSELQKLLAAKARYEAAGSDTSGIDQAIAQLQGAVGAGRGRVNPPMVVPDGAPGAGRGMVNPAPVNPNAGAPVMAGLRAAPTANPDAAPAPRANIGAPPAATPAAPGAPAAPGGFEAQLLAALNNAPKEMTPEQLVAQQNALRTAAGVTDEAGLAKLARANDLKSAYEKTQPTALDDMIRVFSQAGRFKGLSGLGSAYTANQEARRAADLNFQQQHGAMLGAVEDAQRAEKLGMAGKAGEALTEQGKQAAQFGREKMQTLGSVRGQDVQAGSAKYTADMHYKAALAQIADAGRRADRAEKQQLLDSMKTRINDITKEMGPLEKSPFGQNKVRLAELQAEKAGISRALDEAAGISKITGAPGAAPSPGGTTLKYNPATGKIE